MQLQKELRQWMKVAEEQEEVHKALSMSQHKENAKVKDLLHQLERWADRIHWNSERIMKLVLI